MLETSVAADIAASAACGKVEAVESKTTASSEQAQTEGQSSAPSVHCDACDAGDLPPLAFCSRCGHRLFTGVGSLPNASLYVDSAGRGETRKLLYRGLCAAATDMSGADIADALVKPPAEFRIAGRRSEMAVLRLALDHLGVDARVAHDADSIVDGEAAPTSRGRGAAFIGAAAGIAGTGAMMIALMPVFWWQILIAITIAIAAGYKLFDRELPTVAPKDLVEALHDVEPDDWSALRGALQLRGSAPMRGAVRRWLAAYYPCWSATQRLTGGHKALRIAVSGRLRSLLSHSAELSRRYRKLDEYLRSVDADALDGKIKDSTTRLAVTVDEKLRKTLEATFEADRQARADYVEIKGIANRFAAHLSSLASITGTLRGRVVGASASGGGLPDVQPIFEQLDAEIGSMSETLAHLSRLGAS